MNAAEYFFHQGTNYRAYEYMGAHLTDYGGRVFRVWAPDALSVSLVGDFCSWDVGIPMERITDGGIWECTVDSGRARSGHKYKYKIQGSGGGHHYKSDPYSICAEPPPNGASVIYDCEDYPWRDDGWMTYRKSKSGRMGDEPVNVYRLSATEWNRELRCWNELARELAPYVKQMGYTHVELTSVTEKALLYAPQSRMGTPNDFKSFVDSMHEAGVGVIVDRYMVETFGEDYGLCRFDGQPLYERSDGATGYELGRREVECFLVSNAHYWFENFHVDGLRLCGIEPELSFETVGFFRKLNAHIKADFPDVLMMCDRITDRDNVTNFKNGGLGFDFKLCDTALADGEKYILSSPKGFEDMSYARAMYGYFMTAHGKKLTQMGAEIGMGGERSPDWSLLGLDAHARFQRYASELGQLYLSTPALWQCESLGELPENNGGNVITLRRIDRGGREIIILINLTPVALENYRVGVSYGGAYREILNSDDVSFGGGGYVNDTDVRSVTRPCDKCENSIVIRVAPMAISILKCVRKTSTPGKTTTASRTAKTKNIK